ncbi:hypothetical protein JTE88_03015 [Arcanobacterium phocisimile]|uniref:Uncharacterized protein n=1 Tax=Arcanobacterium phocisimile TaxID=1302235 RepID=A0ABX7ILM7_9ACTO|nr:hypothetical protein [Arcanobacterium phocisimile]QRV02723.1 hypothetical protein JTE88_03015 [Arcanobacterium phocisimile]
MKKHVISMIALSSVLFLSGACSPDTSAGEVDDSASAVAADDSVSPVGVDVSAKVDRDSWIIELPVHRYTLSSEDQAYLLSAGSVAMAECTRTKLDGVAWTGFPPEIFMPVNPPVFSEFGPWNKDMAAQFGFTRVETSKTPIANRGLSAQSAEIKAGWTSRSDSNGKMLEKAEAKMSEACDSYPMLKKFDVREVSGSGPWKNEFAETRMRLFDDPRAQEIAGELEACFDKQGLQMNSEAPGFVEGVDGFVDPTEESIALALKAAQCQEETDATPRLAQVWADLQAPIVKKYAKELIAQRALIDERVAEAKQYIQEHPELFELPIK